MIDGGGGGGGGGGGRGKYRQCIGKMSRVNGKGVQCTKVIPLVWRVIAPRTETSGLVYNEV